VQHAITFMLAPPHVPIFVQQAFTVMLEPSHFHQGIGSAVAEMLWQLARVPNCEDVEVRQHSCFPSACNSGEGQTGAISTATPPSLSNWPHLQLVVQDFLLHQWYEDQTGISSISINITTPLLD
jgi:hypothetical protein